MSGPPVQQVRVYRDSTLYVYGLLIVAAGLLIVFLRNSPIAQLKPWLVAALLGSALFALATVGLSRTNHVRFIYHEIHALAMIAFSIALMFFIGSTATFVLVTAFFLLFYFISELIFCSWLFNLGLKIRMYILLQRLMVGAVVGMTAVVMIAYPGLSETQKMTGLGFVIPWLLKYSSFRNRDISGPELSGRAAGLVPPIMNSLKLPLASSLASWV